MKPIALVTAAVVGSLSQIAPAASESDILRNKCAAQERTIKELEKEIDALHALLGKNKPLPKNLLVSTSAAAPNSSASYKVVKGDSMSKIARKHGISLNALVSANPSINPNRLSIGQSLNLPGQTPAKASAKSAPKAQPTAVAEVLPAPIPPAKHAEVPKAEVSTKDYIVKKGDTLYGIARKNNTSVANILEQNQGLDPRKLRPGQSIAIATTKSTSTTQKPAPAVAKKSAPVNKPAPTSTKSPSKKEVAQASTKPAAKKEVAKASTPAPTKKVTHTPKQPRVRTVTVTRQMTFGEFASIYGASVEQINTMNSLKLTKGTVLAQGSELYIPVNQD